MHPIGVVAKRTGITLHVLRAWERRYGVVEPGRTPGGQRLYSDADITRLRLLRQVTDAGRNISQVARLPVAELERLAAEDVRHVLPATAADRGGYLSRCLKSAERLDGDAVYATLMRAAVSLRPAEFLADVLMPLLHEVGERWHQKRLSPAQEHVVSMASRRVVTWLVDAYDTTGEAPVLLVTTVAGEQHEFGALMVSVLALEAGWRVAYLGTSLPAEEIVQAARGTDAAMVAVSIVNTRDHEGMRSDVTAEMTQVRQGLPVSVPLLLGGAGALERRDDLREAGAVVLTDAAALSEVLRVQRELLTGRS